MGPTTVMGIVLLITAFILLAIEAVIPGFGVPGISGLVLLGLGIMMCSHSLAEALVLIAVLAVLLAIMIFVVLKLLSSGKINPPVVLNETLSKDKGFVSRDLHTDLMYQRGQALSDLRPAGKVSINDRAYDVISEGEFIQKGEMVEVISVSNNSLVVRKV
ncbi:MAG: hypothetical protein IJI75_08105 [Solobacterium sp.]|nr:hypothetical protein [Solobacterium sp.]